MNSAIRAARPSVPAHAFDLDVDDFEIVEERLEALPGGDLLGWTDGALAGSVHEAILRFLDEKL